MNQCRTVREQTPHRRFQIQHLQRKADLPAHASPGFQLVDDLRLSLVEKLEGGFAPIIVPDGGGFDSQPMAIELDQTFIITGVKRDPQFKDRMGKRRHDLFPVEVEEFLNYKRAGM